MENFSGLSIGCKSDFVKDEGIKKPFNCSIDSYYGETKYYSIMDNYGKTSLFSCVQIGITQNGITTVEWELYYAINKLNEKILKHQNEYNELSRNIKNYHDIEELDGIERFISEKTKAKVMINEIMKNLNECREQIKKQVK